MFNFDANTELSFVYYVCSPKNQKKDNNKHKKYHGDQISAAFNCFLWVNV